MYLDVMYSTLSFDPGREGFLDWFYACSKMATNNSQLLAQKVSYLDSLQQAEIVSLATLLGASKHYPTLHANDYGASAPTAWKPKQ